MEFRLAVMQDLPELKRVYQGIIKDMYEKQIEIWDDIYPCEFFKEDIQNQRLYILGNNTEIVAAFALCSENPGAKDVAWKNLNGKAMYLDRLGVHVNYANQGIGTYMLEKAKETAKAFGAVSLRLFAVDINAPAIFLYIKNGFTKADGIYHEVIDENDSLDEYGFEITL
jgi:ribosomal protein S18 acetylase RimI-like enzyme